MKRWTFTLRALDRAGVLERIAAVFAERGINIEEVHAQAWVPAPAWEASQAETRAPGAAESAESRVTLTVSGEEKRIRYVRRILERLGDVRGVILETSPPRM